MQYRHMAISIQCQYTTDGEDDHDFHPSGPNLKHFRQHNLKQMYSHKSGTWEKLLQNKMPLPTQCIRLYNTEGNLVEIREIPNIRDTQTTSSSPATPTRIVPQQTHHPQTLEICPISLSKESPSFSHLSQFTTSLPLTSTPSRLLSHLPASSDVLPEHPPDLPGPSHLPASSDVLPEYPPDLPGPSHLPPSSDVLPEYPPDLPGPSHLPASSDVLPEYPPDLPGPSHLPTSEQPDKEADTQVVVVREDELPPSKTGSLRTKLANQLLECWKSHLT